MALTMFRVCVNTSDIVISPTSGEPRTLADTPAPVTMAASNPLCSTSRAVSPSYTPGATKGRSGCSISL